MGGSLIKTDIGHGRGWLAPAPAASLRRIDAQLGRPADINEAGRSPEQADENRRKWLAYERYLKGGPWAPKAPYALGSDQSVHCWGYAADTDDSYNARAAAVWLDNGWGQTALYPNNPAKHEPWHREYREDRDNHRFDGKPAGGSGATEEDDMSAQAEQYIADIRNAIFGPLNGGIPKMSWKTPDGQREAYYGLLDIGLRNQALITAQTAALQALATAKGVDPKAITAVVEKAVKDAMSDVTFTPKIS